MGRVGGRQSKLVWAGVIGPVTFVAIDLLAAALRPGYDLTFHTVSRLAVGPLGWLQTLNFVVVGVLTILLGVGLLARSQLLGGLFGLWGLGFVLLALFPTDPSGLYPLRQRIHYWILDGVALLFPLMCLAAAVAFWQRRRFFSIFSLALCLLVAFVAASWLLRPQEVLASPRLGLYERAIIWTAVMWCLALSWKIRTDEPPCPPPNA
ncbi:MAG: DUF998 domain-containing protein [Chloroflexota bacterium]